MRLKALQICLDRGYGKATQHIEAEISVYDSLDFDVSSRLSTVSPTPTTKRRDIDRGRRNLTQTSRPMRDW